VVYQSSPVQFARTFGPSYSVFVVLQDTTKEMGATGACPGSHMCADGPIAEFCEAEGYQLVGENGYWATGDALLMNMDSWHRGAAHRDPNALDRVMLILTWVPRPQAKAESRQMAQGITYSLRWDHWGMTWRDLRAGRFQYPPWLRSLALFKPSNVVWGLDYISSSSMRIANQDIGFRRHELDTFIERGGGIWYLPKFLHGIVNDDESWQEYLLYTLENCESFLAKVAVAWTGVYVLFFILASYILVKAPQQPQQGGMAGSIRRVTTFHGLVWSIFLLMTYHVDHTQWAKDISKNLRYTNAFVEEEPIYSLDAPTTFPHRRDVLVATRYSSEWLHMYNDWFENHPGNNLLDRLVRSSAKSYRNYLAAEDSLFSRATVRYIVDAIYMEHGRYLHQSTHGTWRLMSDEDAIAYVQQELHLTANPILAKLKREIGFIQSDYRYGEHRSTVLAKKVSLSYLQDLQDKLVLSATTQAAKRKTSNASTQTNTGSQRRRRSLTIRARRPVVVATLDTKATTNKSLSLPRRYANRNIHPQVSSSKIRPTPPHSKAWMKSGDLVEVRWLDEEDRPLWYLGRLVHVTASGKYTVNFFDDSSPVIVSQDEDLRPYAAVRYYEGERVGILDQDQDWYVDGTILKKHSSYSKDGDNQKEDDNNDNGIAETFDVRLQSGQVLAHVHPGMFRRYQ
jgi:hypothetical protein